MSIKFAGNSGGNGILCPNQSAISQPSSGAWVVWVNPLSDGTNNSRIFLKGAPANGYALTLSSGAGTLNFSIQRSGTSLTMQATLTNFSAFAFGKWVCIAVAYDADGGDGDQILYMGDTGASLAEPSAYTTKRVGSGTINTDEGSGLTIGNNGAGSGAFAQEFDGSIAMVLGIRGRRLGLDELRKLQFTFGPQTWHRLPLPGMMFLMFPGFGNVGDLRTQRDWNRYGNHGPARQTVTVSDNPPIPAFSFPETSTTAAYPGARSLLAEIAKRPRRWWWDVGVSGGTTISGVLSATGVGTATWVGAKSATSVLAASGSGTSAWTATKLSKGVLAATGSGTATWTGRSMIQGALAAAGSGTLTAVGAKRATGALAASGSGTLTAVGAKRSAGVLAAAGSGTFTAVPQGTITAVWSASGVGAMSCRGQGGAGGGGQSPAGTRYRKGKRVNWIE